MSFIQTAETVINFATVYVTSWMHGRQSMGMTLISLTIGLKLLWSADSMLRSLFAVGKPALENSLDTTGPISTVTVSNAESSPVVEQDPAAVVASLQKRIAQLEYSAAKAPRKGWTLVKDLALVGLAAQALNQPVVKK